MRNLSYLLDELRGEYEKSLIHLPSGRPVLRMYVGSPLSRGGLGGRHDATYSASAQWQKLSARLLTE